MLFGFEFGALKHAYAPMWTRKEQKSSPDRGYNETVRHHDHDWVLFETRGFQSQSHMYRIKIQPMSNHVLHVKRVLDSFNLLDSSSNLQRDTLYIPTLLQDTLPNKHARAAELDVGAYLRRCLAPKFSACTNSIQGSKIAP
ncbi:hypothetical protein ABKN59_008719 [Abortiporus biennis]